MVGFYFSAKPQRASLKDRWPPSPEENLERLEDAGFPHDRQIPKCGNCGGKHNAPLKALTFISLTIIVEEMGHTARGCKQERAVIERVEVKCVNCHATGHRARDCTEKRHDKFACRNCGYAYASLA